MKLIITTILFVLVLLQTACAVYGTEEEIRDVKTFKSLDISGLAEVFITQAGTQADSQAGTQNIVVKVSGMPITDVITRVEQDTLFVTTKGFHQGESVKVYVTYVHLENITTSGSAELTGTNTLHADALLITTAAASDIKRLKIMANNLSVSINGAGNADLDVEVESIDIVMNGAGDLSVEGSAKIQKIRSNSSRGTLNNSNLAYSK